MQRTVSIVVVALLLTVAPAIAGSDCSSSEAKAQVASDTKKCSYDTQDCLNQMVAHFHDRGWVGIELEADDEYGTLTITRTEPDSPATTAGLQKGDVLVALNGIRFSEENKEAMQGAQAKMTVGATVTYTVERSGRSLDVDVTLAAIPDAVMAKWIGRHMLDHSSITVAEN